MLLHPVDFLLCASVFFISAASLFVLKTWFFHDSDEVRNIEIAVPGYVREGVWGWEWRAAARGCGILFTVIVLEGQQCVCGCTLLVTQLVGEGQQCVCGCTLLVTKLVGEGQQILLCCDMLGCYCAVVRVVSVCARAYVRVAGGGNVGGVWKGSGSVSHGSRRSLLSHLASRDEGMCAAHTLSRDISRCTSLPGLGTYGALNTHESTGKSHTLHWTTEKHTQALHYAQHCKFRVAGTSLVGGSFSKRCYGYIAGHWSCSLRHVVCRRFFKKIQFGGDQYIHRAEGNR